MKEHHQEKEEGMKKPLWCTSLWSTKVTMKVVTSESAIPCSGLPLIFLFDSHKGIFTALRCGIAGTESSPMGWWSSPPCPCAVLLLWHECIPWAIHESHAWEHNWMLRFTKEGAALVQPQSRAGLCTVPLSSAIAVAWSECLLGCFSQDKLMCIFTDLPCSTCSGAPPEASAPTEEAGPEFSFWRNRLCDCFLYGFRKKRRGQNNA